MSHLRTLFLLHACHQLADISVTEYNTRILERVFHDRVVIDLMVSVQSEDVIDPHESNNRA
jgi:hypothetical protein